jgi:hypothetical protein
MIARIFAGTCILVLTANGAWIVNSQNVHGGVLVVCSLIGGLIGWSLAVMATPANENEKLQFGAYARLVTGFLSGFVFTKLNELLSVQELRGFLQTGDNLVQVGYASGYAFACFLIGLMWTFLLRRYTQTRTGEE